MKHLVTALTVFAAAALAVSCDKDTISPEELFNDGSKLAKTTIHTKSDDPEDLVTTFVKPVVYRTSDLEGQSWFCANSGGKMVYDMFMLSIYFDSIDKLQVGDTLKVNRFLFSFFASSDSNAHTHSFGGKITLADKGEDYVILRFHKVSFNCSFGNYVTDGYLYCTLQDEVPSILAY